MNDRVMNINCILDMLKTKSDICRNNMASVLDTDTDQQLYSECLVFIDTIKQVRHSKTLLRHVKRFNKLKLRQGASMTDSMPNSQFNSNNRVPTQNGGNHMNDNNNNHNTNVADVTNRWVVNLSSTPLTDSQTLLLARDP